VKYQCVAAHRREYAVAMMCRLLRIKPSGFYAWLRRPPSRRSLENSRLKKHITAIHAESDGVYGSPKVRDELLQLGFQAGRHRVAGSATFFL
jgi:putative transposase